MRLAIIFILMFSALALPASPERRTLLISAPSPDNDSYQKQAALLLPAWSGLVERDFVVETKFGAQDFAIVLIGKDGGEKLRRTTLLPIAELFALVDAMPMRRAEMRERK